jgi:uncharacterized protein (DUF305 family)
MKTRTFALASSALMALLVLVGCASAGETPDPGPAAESAFNDADAAFAMNMVVHHQQAIDMADLVLAKDGVDERVVALAEAIKQAQGPEIELMNSWLDDWGQSDGMGGMNHGETMSDDDMAALEAASGAEASSLFLEQMIVHHEGAIDMANDELADGENAEALALAGKIVADQTAEIETMNELLASL